MVNVIGVAGLKAEKPELTTSPPYDVIKEGTELEDFLKANKASLYHIILGNNPKTKLEMFKENGILEEDNQPCFYVYEQVWNMGSSRRVGVFAAAEVSDYDKGKIIRHEKTFDEKVQGRMKLSTDTGYSFGPVFCLVKNPELQELMEKIVKGTADQEFTSNFNNLSELHGIKNRIFRIPDNSTQGELIKSALRRYPLYIADGHHRYHTALKLGQTHFLAYICSDAKILAYNRVVNPPVEFESILEQLKEKLDVEEVDTFQTPKKNQFCIYTGEKTYMISVKEVPDDVVGKLDVSILEKEVYPLLGLTHEMITDQSIFDYYAETELKTMKELVDRGKYKIAIALAPVDTEELMDVADKGLEDPETVMPEKSTYFAPKILSGIIIYKHKISD